MLKEIKVNDFVVRFVNVNGTGSTSANNLFTKSIFRMGIPVSPKNIFPSNIQGLPTWFEVRISEKSYLGRKAGVDVMVAVNPQSFAADIDLINPGGYLIYDNSKNLHKDYFKDDIHYLGIPMTFMTIENYEIPRLRQLFKNIIYIGALAALIDIEMDVIAGLISEQFAGKPKLIPPNIKALELGYNYARENFECPLPFRLERRDAVNDKILIDGNSACALGAIYAGATIACWYPITPSTSVVDAFTKFTHKWRVDKESGKNKFAILQAEDELAAIGMVIGASWNGARAFTATSGPGVSLMSEFIGLAYFAEIPVVLIDVQRGGPSTGMPTRTQQSDILLAAYASHGDTKHPLLFPDTPKECFDMTVMAFDLADRLQTIVIVMSDLDLGMNDHLSEPFEWDDAKKYDRGKVLSAEDLEKINNFGRYLDVDGDGIPYRTIPGTHPTKGAFFTRGTSRNEYARYTEDGATYVRNMDRLTKKWETTKTLVPKAEFFQNKNESEIGMIFFGTTSAAAKEVFDLFINDGLSVDAMRIKAFPFDEKVKSFIKAHKKVFVVEQNRDAQMRQLIINELDIDPLILIPVLNYDGNPITADIIYNKVVENTELAVSG